MAPIPRRAVLAAPLLLLAAAPPLPIPPGRRIAFAVHRRGSRIGTHRVDFTGDQRRLDVRITVDIKVTFGPFVLYSYSLRGLEQWQNGLLMHAAGNANDDGAKRFARATREGDRLAVQGSAVKPYLAPPGSIPASHWNEEEIRHPMINAENGALMTITVQDRGMEMVLDEAGGRIAARHYALTWREHDTKLHALDLWYEPTGTWAGLTAVASDGSLIVYRRLVP